MQDTTAFEKIESMSARICIVQGGTSAGKTWDILAILMDIAVLDKGCLISVVTDTLPNLRRGAMRDFVNILKLTQRLAYWNENKSTCTFALTNGSIIEFFSTEDDGALGARRDYLFINEANRISFETFNQLEVRTKKKIYLDFNPSNEFWVHKELMPKRDDWEFIKVNYLDNESLDENIVKSIEQRKGDGTSNWWRVYGLGEIGSLEGNIYEGWQVLEDIPDNFVLKRYGVDFGFSNDPTAVIAVYENENEEILLDQKLCKVKMLTPELIEFCKGLQDGLFVCDNARPEIIAEMQRNGLRAIGSNKTAGEKMNGKRYNIELVQRRKVYYTASSKELEREFLSYAWRKKKSTGEVLDEPQDGNDHCMDAIAYAVRDMAKQPVIYAGLR